MTCQPVFEKKISFECVQDLIADVRSGTVTVETAKKGLWLAGCGMEFFAPKAPIGDVDLADLTDEELCDAIEVAVKVVKADDKSQIDPATVLMIIQLVWNILKQLKK
jgi:hypothetical protein